MPVALLVADDPILRALWQQLLHVHDGPWSFVHSPGGHEALRALDAHRPDLVISDASLAAVDVAELVQRAADELPAALVVLAGDAACAQDIEGHVARLSRVSSGTIELPALVRNRFGRSSETLDLRHTSEGRDGLRRVDHTAGMRSTIDRP